jgi:dipeptidyl aminopeptidase/acylaminoacyl peptidase
VREDHRQEGEAINTLVAVNMEAGGEGAILFEGTDFVTNPTLSPDGSELAFITWSHPNMRWDDTQLRIISLDDNGGVAGINELGQNGNVSIQSPKYSSDGTLYFVADFNNWWTLFKVDGDGNPLEVISDDIEMGSYGFESEASAIITYASSGLYYLARVDLGSGTLSNIGEAFAYAGSVNPVSDGVYFTASTPSSQTAIYKLTGGDYGEVYRPNGPSIDDDYLSISVAISYTTGNNNTEQAFGFYYPPKNVDFRGPDGTLPPLIVKVHGGPVGATKASLAPSIQFWTSRGFAVFDVNHRGSTGYGRAFRKLLYPNWGIVDIEDVANGANWLTIEGFVDGDKLAIRGGSAGGYTVLAAMAFQNIFKAGTSYFGISDLEAITKETHKYESHFADQLIGPYPEKRDVYLARSPIHHVDNINAPLLMLQGLDDEVVPPNQSEMIFEALKNNCIPTAYLSFEGEGHGFRQPANQIRSLNAELDFYGQIFGFTPAGNIEPVELITCE